MDKYLFHRFVKVDKNNYSMEREGDLVVTETT
jgi:hypothetical protein